MMNGFFGKIDRYIIWKFFSSFLFTILLIVSISISIDITEHIDKFLANNLSVGYIISNFYLNFIPYIIALLGPYFVCITVIFFTSQLASRSEIVAMFNSGMSFKRLLFPYIFTSGVLAIVFWISNNYIIPNANKKRLAFENKYIAYESYLSSDHLHRKINDSTFLYFRIFDKSASVATTVSLEQFSGGKIKKKYLAERALWDTIKKNWTFQNLYIRNYSDSGNSVQTLEKEVMTFDLDPTIFTKRWSYIEELTSPELREKIADLKKQGVDNTAEFECELHRRTASCFGIILLTIIGATIASKKVRGGMGLHLMAGITLCSVFEVLQKFSISFAIKAHFPPLLAIWIPNLIFILIEIYLWFKFQEN